MRTKRIARGKFNFKTKRITSKQAVRQVHSKRYIREAIQTEYENKLYDLLKFELYANS